MMNRVDDIISALDFKFAEQPSSKRSVVALDGELIRINDELWKKSPVLRVHASTGISHKRLAASKSALKALNDAHTDGIFPTGIRELYELLAAASELCLGELTSECFENLCILNAFDESVDLPSELSVDTVMRVFNFLLSGPLRTVDIYESQLSRIARYCPNNRDVMTNALNSLKQGLGRFRDIDLEGIPASFDARTLPVAIYRRKGELQTVVIIGDEVRPVNLFGNRINLEDIKGNGFYLKYGVYLLYNCGGPVHYKDLHNDSEPREVLSNCHQLLTKGNFVLAVHNERFCGQIFLWNDDLKFEKIYQPDETIQQVDIDQHTRLLAVALSEDRFRLFRLENRTLFLLKDISLGGVTHICLSGRDMFILREMKNETEIEAHCVEAMGDAGSRSIDKQPAGKDTPTRIKCSESYYRIYHVGGSYFLRSYLGLRLVSNFPSLDETRALMAYGELAAFSELSMSP